MIKTHFNALVSKLSGMALNFAVAKLELQCDDAELVKHVTGITRPRYDPLEKWVHASDLADLFNTQIVYLGQEKFEAYCGSSTGFGLDPIHASLRSLVTEKIGPIFPVPVELLLNMNTRDAMLLFSKYYVTAEEDRPGVYHWQGSSLPYTCAIAAENAIAKDMEQELAELLFITDAQWNELSHADKILSAIHVL